MRRSRCSWSAFRGRPPSLAWARCWRRPSCNCWRRSRQNWARQLLPFYFDPLVVRAASESAGPPASDGWIQATIPIESRAYAQGELLRLGPEAEVLAPAELRERIAEAAAALPRLYHCPAAGQ